MKKEKVKYVLDRIIRYFGIVFVVYLVYTFFRTLVGIDFKYMYRSSPTNEQLVSLGFELKYFYLNSALHTVALTSVASLRQRYWWLLILEIILVFIVPAVLVIGAELKKHNEKVKSFFDKRKEKKLIRLEKQLNDLKDKEL